MKGLSSCKKSMRPNWSVNDCCCDCDFVALEHRDTTLTQTVMTPVFMLRMLIAIDLLAKRGEFALVMFMALTSMKPS